VKTANVKWEQRMWRRLRMQRAENVDGTSGGDVGSEEGMPKDQE
jgi:hypothetical protein